MEEDEGDGCFIITAIQTIFVLFPFISSVHSLVVSSTASNPSINSPCVLEILQIRRRVASQSLSAPAFAESLVLRQVDSPGFPDWAPLETPTS